MPKEGEIEGILKRPQKSNEKEDLNLSEIIKA